jgi:hypothetical protein
VGRRRFYAAAQRPSQLALLILPRLARYGRTPLKFDGSYFCSMVYNRTNLQTVRAGVASTYTNLTPTTGIGGGRG